MEVVSPKLTQILKRLLQVVAVLQLEKPSDWLAYQLPSMLSPDELVTPTVPRAAQRPQRPIQLKTVTPTVIRGLTSTRIAHNSTRLNFVYLNSPLVTQLVTCRDIHCISPP
jgi:hypothetical protein